MAHYACAKNDFIHKTESAQHIATPPKNDRATVLSLSDERNNFGTVNIGRVAPEIMLAVRRWFGVQSARDNHTLARNLAKYSSIKKFHIQQ